MVVGSCMSFLPRCHLRILISQKGIGTELIKPSNGFIGQFDAKVL